MSGFIDLFMNKSKDNVGGVKVNGYTADQLGSGLASKMYDPAMQGILGDSNYTGALSNAGIDINSLTTDQLVNGYNSFSDTGKLDFSSMLKPTDSIDWSLKGVGSTVLGGAQLGLGLLSYLNQKKLADKQGRLIDQQITANDYNIKKTKADDQHIIDVFNPSYKPTYV